MAYDNIGASVFETIALEVVYNVANDQNLPAFTKLNKNYPNPFNPQTSISYSLKQAGPVKIEIFNVKGQLVRTLVNTTKKAGKYNAVWFGQNDSGSKVGSGIYFYKMQTTDFTDIERMLLLK
jgi:flagellar hook assembly protein FlgD